MNGLYNQTIMVIQENGNQFSHWNDISPKFRIIFCSGSTSDYTALFVKYPEIKLLLLCDEIARVNGFEIITTFRKRYPLVPVILFSNHIDMQNIKLATLLGCNDVLQIPGDECAMEAIIQGYLNI